VCGVITSHVHQIVERKWKPVQWNAQDDANTAVIDNFHVVCIDKQYFSLLDACEIVHRKKCHQ
jgi:hypothetical protein